MLIRHHAGEKLGSVVRVPSRQDEQRRQLHRDLEDTKAEATQHRIRGVLAGVGAGVGEVRAAAYSGQPPRCPSGPRGSIK